MAPTPSDKKLYALVKQKNVKKNPTHSAYRSGLIVKEYKSAYARKHGKSKSPYIGAKPRAGLTDWFAEDWSNQRGESGYKKPGDVYRPNKRVNKSTPTTYNDLSGAQIRRAMSEKKETGRVKSFSLRRRR